MTKRRPSIAVVGSINMDLLVRTPSLPRPGETIIGHEVSEVSGGKGANQAVAAARLGASVDMLGRVGSDGFGTRLKKGLQDTDISCNHIQPVEDSSGIAIVVVEDSGQNSIVAIPGANSHVSPSDVKAFADSIASADVLLVQFEIPLESVLTAMQFARAADVPVVLDPAPAKASPPAEIFDVDYLCPNETEAEALTGISVSGKETAMLAAAKLQSMGARNCIITLGQAGALLASENGDTELVPSFKIDAVDTTAAGDAFAGALAVAIASGNKGPEAVRFACAAGAVAASKLGAQPSMPTQADIDAVWTV